MNLILEKYKEYLINKKYSENSIHSYCEELERYFQWVNLYTPSIDSKVLEEVRWEDIEDGYLPCGNISNATYNKRHSTLKVFYDYLIKREMCSINPMNKINKLKIQKKEPIFLTKEEVDEILFQARNFQGENSKRNNCILLVFLESGIRLSELTELKKTDFTKNRIHVEHGKGDKERFTFISNTTLIFLKAYWDNRKDSSPYAFVTGRGEPKKITEDNIRKIVINYTKMASINKNITPHKLRHTFATHYYEKTKDLRRLQMILGHASSNTTDIYAHVVNNAEEENIQNGLYN